MTTALIILGILGYVLGIPASGYFWYRFLKPEFAPSTQGERGELIAMSLGFGSAWPGSAPILLLAYFIEWLSYKIPHKN